MPKYDPISVFGELKKSIQELYKLFIARVIEGPRKWLRFDLNMR